jgi:hypothetical protein
MQWDRDGKGLEKTASWDNLEFGDAVRNMMASGEDYYEVESNFQQCLDIVICRNIPRRSERKSLGSIKGEENWLWYEVNY